MDFSIIQKTAAVVPSTNASAKAAAGNTASQKTFPKDSFSVSETASDIVKVQNAIAALTDKSSAREEAIKNIAIRIDVGTYNISDAMADQIAQRIARSYV